MTPHWLDTTEYPFASKFSTVNGHKLHYIDEGEGPTILFVHGTPSWSFDYRNVVKELSKNNRCIAVDHIGFGLSDKPEEYDYSTANHSRTLERFALSMDLRDITLVVHDFGGPIGLNFALQHPYRIKNMVILNSWLWSADGEPDFIRLKKVLKSPLLPFLYKRLNVSPLFILPASFGDHKLSSKLRRQYTAPFGNGKQRNGPLAFARSLLNDQAWFESLWQQKHVIASKPTTFVWGMKDKVIGHSHLEKFHKGFPNSKVIEVATAGHFPQEEQPGIVAEAIKSMLRTSLPD